VTDTIQHNERKSRFEIFVDGELAGIAHYDLSNGVATFDHTEVLPKFGGRGLASTLIGGAFDQVRADAQWKVRTTCSFAAAFAGKHPEYSDILVQ